MAADDAASGPSLPLKDVFKLVYITSLVVLAVLALFLLHVLGSVRRRSSHKLLHAVLLGAYTLSYALVSYTLGLMQSSTYYFNEFSVWAVCLLMLLGGTDNLMACKLNDVDDWKSFHVKHFLKGVLVVYIVAAYTNNDSPDKPYDPSRDATQYRLPLWAILFVNVFQSCMRINSMKMASKSNLLAKNVKPIDDHMKDEDQSQTFDPLTLEGYNYVVSGEHRLIEKRRNIKHGEKNDDKQLAEVLSKKLEEMNVTTVEKIWKCRGSLLWSESKTKRCMQLKDICLSMALSKMLNRRFAGFKLAEAGLDKTHDFVFKGLLLGEESCERTFRVIEAELGFIYDLYYTRYPYLYNKVRHFALCLPVAMVSFCSWLTYVIFKKHEEAKHTEAGPGTGRNKDNISLCTTLFLMAVVTFLEAFQLYLHVASNWYKVALIRSYVTRPALQGSVWSMIISLPLRLKALRPWENKLGQYCLLQNYDGTRHTSNCIHYMTLWLVDKAKKGCKRGKLVKLSKEVKTAVIDSLKKSDGHLTNGVRSLQANGVYEQLWWACGASEEMVTHTIQVKKAVIEEGKDCLTSGTSWSPEIHEELLPWVHETSDEMLTHTILVWHIATSICKHKFDAALPRDGKKTGVSSAEEDNREVLTRGRVLTASSLSQYCAYLIAFAPDLLPGHCFDSASTLDKCIRVLGDLTPHQGAKTMEKKCEMLMTPPLPGAETTMKMLMSDSKDPASLVIKLGARLASELTNIGEVQQWKVLSDFWAEMILYIAPCDDAKARAHLEALARGGEFITHLWALLTHAGVLARDTPPPARTGSEAGMLECAPTGLDAV